MLFVFIIPSDIRTRSRWTYWYKIFRLITSRCLQWFYKSYNFLFMNTEMIIFSGFLESICKQIKLDPHHNCFVISTKWHVWYIYKIGEFKLKWPLFKVRWIQNLNIAHKFIEWKKKCISCMKVVSICPFFSSFFFGKGTTKVSYLILFQIKCKFNVSVF